MRKDARISERSSRKEKTSGLTVVLGSWNDDIGELGTRLHEVVVTWLDESGRGGRKRRVKLGRTRVKTQRNAKLTSDTDR